MKINEQAQEQLEQLWISEEENGSLPEEESIAGFYQELTQLGLVYAEGGSIRLTTSGKAEAANAIRRHRLAERLVVDVLVTEGDLVEEQACSLEHALVDGIEESICTLLGHPRTCPHGKPIPPGRCCQQMRLTLGALIAPLSELKVGQEGRIAYLHLHKPRHLHKLMAMGVLPGAPMRVKTVYPSIVFEVGFSQFAVDSEIASEIYVRIKDQD